MTSRTYAVTLERIIRQHLTINVEIEPPAIEYEALLERVALAARGHLWDEEVEERISDVRLAE